MATMKITGLANAVAEVTVFEPRQTPEQAEVVIDTFRLEPGEVRDYELDSATAAYRLEPVRSELAEGFVEPAPDQEPIYGRHPDTDAELQAGRERLSLAEESRLKSQEEVARAPQRRAAEASGAHPTMRNPNAKAPEGAGKKGQDKAAAAHQRADERRKERAAEKTKGQEHADAENPSPQTGTTGQADVDAEQAGRAPSPEEVEQNKSNKR